MHINHHQSSLTELLAGIDRHAIRKSETGVWIGSFVKGDAPRQAPIELELTGLDYEQITLRDCDDQPQYGATGNGTAIMSNRLSYFLDVNGPSMTIDTGCSASLVCVHQACQSLISRETDLVCVVDLMIPFTGMKKMANRFRLLLAVLA